MAITVIPDTTDTAVDTMVDMPAVTTDMVATTDTPTDMATVTSARGPLMLNPRLMLMLPLMPGMATTDTDTVDTTVMAAPTTVDTTVDTGGKF